MASKKYPNQATMRNRLIIVEDCITTGMTTTDEVKEALKGEGHTVSNRMVEEYIRKVTKSLKKEDSVRRERRRTAMLRRLHMYERKIFKKLQAKEAKNPNWRDLISVQKLIAQVGGLVQTIDKVPEVNVTNQQDDRTSEECQFYAEYGCWPEEWPDTAN